MAILGFEILFSVYIYFLFILETAAFAVQQIHAKVVVFLAIKSWTIAKSH